MSSNSVCKVKVPTLSYKTNFPNSTFTLSDYFSCTTDSSYQIVYFQCGMMIYQVTYKLNENSMDTDYLRDGFQKLLNIVLKWFHTQKHFHQARNGLLDLLFSLLNLHEIKISNVSPKAEMTFKPSIHSYRYITPNDTWIFFNYWMWLHNH